MDKFEGKVRSALNKLEAEGMIRSEPVEDDESIIAAARSVANGEYGESKDCIETALHEANYTDDQISAIMSKAETLCGSRVINPDTSEDLIDPMKFDDTAEDLEAKKQKWMDIFNLHPDLADNLLNLISDLEVTKEIDDFNELIQKMHGIVLKNIKD